MFHRRFLTPTYEQNVKKKSIRLVQIFEEGTIEINCIFVIQKADVEDH